MAQWSFKNHVLLTCVLILTNGPYVPNHLRRPPGGMDDVAKLVDFGLVRASSRATAPPLSEDGQILGTPLCISPEQATGARELDDRSDIYSPGAVSYHLLTGRPPFDEGAGSPR